MASVQRTALYDKWFQIADRDRDGRLTGQDAVPFFEKSNLPRDVLAKVWDLANSARLGYLDRFSFHKAMDLISMAQQGMEVTKDNYVAYSQGSNMVPPTMNLPDHQAQPPTQTQDTLYPSQDSSDTAQQLPYSVPVQTYTQAAQPAEAPVPSKSGRPWNRPEPPVNRKVLPAKLCTSIVDGLKSIYFGKVRPLEEQYKFGHFFSPLLHESDFEAKPSVLLLGQYSTGKTTFIKYLLGQSYPGCHIGPEPTTDRFVVVFHGLEERRIPGNTLAVQPDKPYQSLNRFGTGFLSRFEGSQCNAKLLEEITIVDTPGVLSGEKQRIERNYNFIEITEWFAARCDLIFLLFDPYKLDISDEFKQVISILKGHDDKVRVVLNKSDQVDQQQLMRVYGALMWSLGKVFKSPEVCKVYVGSFNSEAPINDERNPYFKALFEAEQRQLLQDLYEIPHRSCDRKVNEFVKRVRAARIHLLIIGHLRKQMPTMFGKEKAQRKLLEDLEENFRQVQREYHLPMGDFPDVNRFREILSAFDLLTFPKVDKKMIKAIDDVLSIDIPALIQQFDNPFP